jgi:hypothetical protein
VLFWSSQDSQIFWGANASTFWPTSTFLEMTYIATVIPDNSVLPGRIFIDTTIVGIPWTIEYTAGTPVDGYLFWAVPLQQGPLSTDLFWPSSGSALYWGGSLASAQPEWLPWLGAIEDPRHIPYKFRLKTGASATQGVISAFTVTFDVDDVFEDFKNLDVPITGLRLPLTKTYREVTHITIDLEEIGTDAIIAKIIDYDKDNGPLIAVYSDATTLTTGRINARVKGY